MIGGSPVSPRDLLQGGHSRGISVLVTDWRITIGGWSNIGLSSKPIEMQITLQTSLMFEMMKIIEMFTDHNFRELLL